jgi:hypothetical protein
MERSVEEGEGRRGWVGEGEKVSEGRQRVE